MTKPMLISLRPGERVYINGAVLQVDRKVTIELLNDAMFLLEGHVMHYDETTTPLRQLYFVVQTMLMDPINADNTRALFKHIFSATVEAFHSEAIIAGLKVVETLVA